MWAYYGSKGKLVGCYPPPKLGKIIEPFAGSARYALRYFEKEVLLVDKYKSVVEIWRFFQKSSKKDILGLPILKPGQDIRSFNLSKEELSFMRFNLAIADAAPRWICTPMCTSDTQIRTLKKIAENLFKIRHWEIKHGDYKNLINEKATWFVDPPYQHGGHVYKESNKKIDFKKLANWCQSRKGQVIVCENTKADWMNFKPMKQMRGFHRTTVEAIWSKIPTAYDNTQLSMFN